VKNSLANQTSVQSEILTFGKLNLCTLPILLSGEPFTQKTLYNPEFEWNEKMAGKYEWR